MAGWTYRVSAAGVLVLAAAAFTLSYDALHQLALDSRVRPGLARAAGVSERYGQRLLAEFTADPTRTDHPNGDSRTGKHQSDASRDDGEGR